MSHLTSIATFLRAAFGRRAANVDPVTATPADATSIAGALLTEYQADRRRERRWSTFRRGLTTAFVIGSLGLSVYTTASLLGWLPLPDALANGTAANDTVAVVSIKGPISADNRQGSADAVIPAVRRAFHDEGVHVIVLRIDSPGGSPQESERITSEIDRLRKETGKQVEAVIDNMGASAAYMIAVHADRVTAGRYSLVGSVGAIMSLWNGSELAEKLGVSQTTYASGSLKDFGSMTRKPTAAERDKGQALVGGIGAIFADEVIATRGDRLRIKRVELTTGEAWSGADAKRLGLVDEVGTLESVLAHYDARGRDFGPSRRGGVGGLFAQWAAGLGSAFASGVASELAGSVRVARVGD